MEQIDAVTADRVESQIALEQSTITAAPTEAVKRNIASKVSFYALRDQFLSK